MMPLSLTLDKSVEFDFDYTYSPGEPAEWDYPGSAPDIDITKVRLNGVEIPLAAISEDMYEAMIRQVNDNY